MLSRKLTSQYQAAFGLFRVLLSHEEFIREFRELFEFATGEWLLLLNSTQAAREDFTKYKTVRFLDTFFSDTIPEGLLTDVVRGTKRYGYRVRLLLLDPFSEQARVRARSLGELDPIAEINKALRSVRSAMGLQVETLRPAEEKIQLAQESYINEQIRHIKSGSVNTPVEVRFYNVLTESPFYILHQYAMKGQIRHQKSAADNPWLIFVDDPRQENDVYDFLCGNFDAVWLDANEYPGGREVFERDSCFVALPFDENKDEFLNALRLVCGEFSLSVTYGGQNPLGRPMDTVRAEIHRAGIVIADLTHSRPSVLFEVGMAFEARKHLVLVSKETAMDAPFNVRDQNILLYGQENNRSLEMMIADAFAALPEICSRRFQLARRIASEKNFYFEHYFGAHSLVVGCDRAATERGHDVQLGLKTMIVQADEETVAVHVPGNKKVNLSAVMAALGVKSATIADVSVLSAMLIVEPGTVCPFTPLVWNIRHLVSNEVLKKKVMFTNDGTHMGYLAFSPLLLLETPNNLIGKFSR